MATAAIAAGVKRRGGRSVFVRDAEGDDIAGEASLKNYHLLPTVRADFLSKLGQFSEASAELQRAAGMTRNAREKAMLLDRAAEAARKAAAE